MNRFFKFFTLFLFLSIGQNLFSQTMSVKGLLCDSTSSPESFATIRLYLLPDSVKPAASGVSDESGVFNIKVKKPGEYRVNVFSFGKGELNRDVKITEEKPVVDLGKLILYPKTSELQEVTVTAKRPLVTKEIDRIGYDVQADEDSKTSQLDEILKKVPLVSVDPDGTIKVKGSTDFKIYKNGRPNNSFSRNAKDIFKALPASMIKKVEVITDPGAREDAEGTSAILNIVTVNNTIIKGVMGNIGFNISTTNPIPSPNLWIQTQIDKFNVSGYGGFSEFSKKQQRSRSESHYVYDESGNELNTSSKSNGSGRMGYFGIDASLELDTLNLLTAEFSGFINSMNTHGLSFTSMTASDGSPVYSYTTVTKNSPNRYFDLDGRFNYQRSTRRKGETLTLSYLISSTNQRQHNTSDYEDELNLPVPYTGTSNDFTLNFLENTLQFDWTRPINDLHKFDVGAKYINRRNHSVNDQDYFDYETTHSDFIHITQVLALYADYRMKYKRLGARAGLRYEYSNLSAKYRDGSNAPFSSNLSDWVPNVSFSYDLNDANTLKFSYSTRINRPGIGQLNPARVETPSSISEGNPDLESSLNHSLGLNYNLIGPKVNLDFNTNYSFSNNSVISVQEMLPGDITRSTFANEGRNKWLHFSTWVNYNVTRKTSIMLNGSAYYNNTSNPSLKLKTHGWGYSAYMRIRQTLPWDLSITVHANTYQSGPSLYGRNKTPFSDRFFYGLTIQKSLLKERRLSININISNPFGRNTMCYESEPVNAGYTGYSRNYSFNRANVFYIGASYRFGSLNAQVKKTAASITNDDVSDRKN